MRRRAAIAGLASVLAAAMVTAAALSAPAQGDRAAARPLVLAAASLTEVLPRIAPDASYSFGSSNSLAEQVRRGAPFDVYLSASPSYTQALYRETLTRKPVAFATNSLVIVVPRSNPAKIKTVFDLARRPKLKLVVAAPKVPIGLYTREVLKRLGLLRVLKKTVSLEPDVKGIVGKVALGQADAGFVYLTDVGPVASRVRAIRIPDRAQPNVVYELAIAADPNDLAAAQGFVIAVLGPDGRRELRAARFGLP
ncbi:MAG: molybdate ABC transporter substrate-binding protein [Actinobacteria bacterium]|nr:molybdate ABC transporter substrate-binding protein [Actinomycetota bacterium]